MSSERATSSLLDCVVDCDAAVTGGAELSVNHAARIIGVFFLLCLGALWASPLSRAQLTGPTSEKKADAGLQRPKLVVLIVVDQLRADYLERFRGQWNMGLKRLIDEGAWFRNAAYPYAATETCVGHATISTGSFPVSHGMIANGWWDRSTQKPVTCTFDPSVQNVAYGGAATKGNDSAARMLMPSFAEELKFQSGGPTRIVTFSLKARAAITMAGHKADAVTWLDGSNGALVTSSAYPTAAFVEDFSKKNPVAKDFGAVWSLSLPAAAYLYDEKTPGTVGPDGWAGGFPHALKGKEGSKSADEAFYEQWASSPFADTYLTSAAENAVDALGLGKGAGTDFLGISYSSVDYVGHAYGPRSREIQDLLVRLDRDLGGLLSFLDQRVGHGNYVVALSADHGVAPVPEDAKQAGINAGVANLAGVQERIEKVLEPYHFAKPTIAKIAGSEIYFAPSIYEQLKLQPAVLQAVISEIHQVPGIAAVYTAEELAGGERSLLDTRTAFEWSYYPGRSGDLFILQKPYWLLDSAPAGMERRYGTSHGTPYAYDQRVPVLLYGFGIREGEYLRPATPADIAPTLAVLCSITLATREGHALTEALLPSPTTQLKPAIH